MRSLAAALGLLARLVPGQGARRAAEFDAAARDAYRTALKIETAAALAPAAHVPPAADEPASARPVAPDAEPAAVQTTSSTVAEPTAVDHASRWASPPGLQDRPVPPRREPDDSIPAQPRRRKRGETAPESMLRTPPDVAPVADDFFDSIMRQVEGDR
jgi:hypothetical protein